MQMIETEHMNTRFSGLTTNNKHFKMADEKKLDLSGVHCGGGYSSEFNEDQESSRTWRDDELSGIKRKSNTSGGIPSKRFLASEYDREEARAQRFHFLGLDAYSRHKKMINDYLLYYGPGIEHYKRDSSRDRNDYDVLREEHRFLWNEEDDSEDTWEKRMAKKYYDKLFKEYCISDLSRYKENKVALRWRVEKEVLDGKGQFVCGNKKCGEREGLRSWEVNFVYAEHGKKKNALVKLRLCPDCSYKLNYHHKKKLAKQKQKEVKEEHKEKAEKRKNKRKSKKKHRGERSRHRNSSSSSEESADSCEGEEKGSVETPGSSHETYSTTTSNKAPSDKGAEKDIWSGPAKITVDKTRDEEFDEYFQDMFL